MLSVRLYQPNTDVETSMASRRDFLRNAAFAASAPAALITFVDERPDGRMSHYIQGARMMPRTD